MTIGSRDDARPLGYPWEVERTAGTPCIDARSEPVGREYARSPKGSLLLRARPALRSTAADWRAFASPVYRRFRILAIAQGLIGALTGPAITIPLLLALGAPPAVATVLAVLPAAGTMSQRWLPAWLDRTDGNLRGLVILFATIGEPRGLVLGGIVALAAAGLLPAGAAVALIGVTSGLLGALGAIASSLQQSWYGIVLADDERRLVAPRLGGITLGIGSLVLLPIAVTIDALVAGIGLWAYVVPLTVSGLAGFVPLLVLRRLPSPGRIRVPRGAAWVTASSDRLRRHGRVMTLALLAAGLSPFLSVYSMTILGTGAGFAILVSAVSSATLVIASIAVSSHLRGGSSSRLLRVSFVLRAGALAAALLAHPVNPMAEAVVLVVAVALAAGDTAGQLAANERLMRLATGPDVLAFQSRFVVRTVGAYAGGVAVSSTVMLLGGFGAFALLFVGAGIVRWIAARSVEVPRQVGTETAVHEATSGA